MMRAVLMLHALDDGSVPPDDVVRCLGFPFAIVQVLRPAECVGVGYLRLVRPALGYVEHTLLDHSGISDVIAIPARRDRQGTGKAVAPHGTRLRLFLVRQPAASILPKLRPLSHV